MWSCERATRQGIARRATEVLGGAQHVLPSPSAFPIVGMLTKREGDMETRINESPRTGGSGTWRVGRRIAVVSSVVVAAAVATTASPAAAAVPSAMNHDAANPSILGATVLVCLLTAVGGLALSSRHGGLRGLLAAAVIGIAFQVGHFTEHAAQAGYWVAHRAQAPWMTPWAHALADSFGALAPGTPGFGMEALHLVGNAIFLAGAVAALATLARVGPSRATTLARRAVLVQAIHVAEHVALTTSVVAGRRPIGLSTLFGTVDPGPTLWTYRVWWHFTINAVATTFVLLAAVEWRRHAERDVHTPRPALARS